MVELSYSHIIDQHFFIFLVLLEIWAEMIFVWPTFKIICDTPIFYKL
jgi:hypothetical protein